MKTLPFILSSALIAAFALSSLHFNIAQAEPALANAASGATDKPTKKRRSMLPLIAQIHSLQQGELVIDAKAGAGGSVSPARVNASLGQQVVFSITPNSGFSIDKTSGCPGNLVGNTFTTAALEQSCTLNVTFAANSYKVSTKVSGAGSITPPNATVSHGKQASFTLTADSGYTVSSVTGCNGNLSGNTYTTGAVTRNCTVTANFSELANGITYYEKQVTFADNQSLTLYSVIPQQIAHKPEDIQYSAATHLQALLLQTGMAFDDSEQLVRAALGLFSHNVLALVPASHDANLNNRLLELANREGITLTALLQALKDELLQTETRPYYLLQLANWQPLRLNATEVMLVNNAPVTVLADASSMLPLNPNYSLEINALGLASTQLNASQYEFVVDTPGVHTFLLSVINNQLASRDGIFSENLNAGAQQQLSLKETEDETQLEVAAGLLVAAVDVVQNGSNWAPVLESSTQSGELLAVSVEQLAGPVTFTYQYSPSTVPNPLELMIVVEDAFNSRLIAPDSVDYLNNTVTFTYQPATNAPQLAAMGTTKANSNRVMLHIRQVKGAPTGKDIDDLLDGRRSYLEQAVRAGLGIVTDLRRDISSEQQAINALIEPLYSNNSAVKAIARAKLTKVLQQRQPNGDYAYYEQFTTAINMAVAAEVLENINWSNHHIDIWFKNSCYNKPALAMCLTYLDQSFKNEGPRLLNEGLSLYLGASSLSGQQKASLQIFKVLATLAGSGAVSGTPKNSAEFGILMGSLGIAGFVDNPWVGRTWGVSTGLAQYLLAAGRLPTVGISFLVGEAITFIADEIEDSVKTINVKAYTPIIFALKRNKDKLFEKSTIWAGVAAPWNRDDFGKSFLTGPFESLRSALQPPVITGRLWWKSWSSQFGTNLDPGRRLEPLLLSVPASWEAPGWVGESSISDKARYEALYFLSAAFGDKQKIQNLKQQANLAMSFTVTKGLLDAVQSPLEDVLELGKMQPVTGQRSLLIKSEYGTRDKFLCTAFPNLRTGEYDTSCLNSATRRQKLQLSVQSMQTNNAATKKYIGSFANVAGAVALNEVLYLQLQPNAYQALQSGVLVFSNLNLEVKGYDIKLANQEASLDKAIQPLTLTYGRVNASQFNYDAALDRYVLPLPKLFPQLAHSSMNNRLLGFSLQARFEHAGKVRNVTGLVAYTTVVDDRYIVNTELHTETIRGRVLSASNQPVANVQVRTSPGNRIVTTNAQGDFELTSLNLGRYSLFITAPSGAVIFSPYSTDKYEFTAIFTANPVSTGGSGKLNDTGIDWCANNDTNNLACPVAGFAGQDGEHGRDALARAGQLQKVGGGAAGFDFTKLDANGNDLPASASAWSCVRDNHTGLIWEVKTNDGGLRDRNNTYTWYNPDSSTNGGDAGTQNGGNCSGSDCDAHSFVQAVNRQGLCGANDWRIPKLNEFMSVMNLGRSYVLDMDYFEPIHSFFGIFWTSSNVAWSAGRYINVVHLANGSFYVHSKASKYHIILMRSHDK